MSQGVYVLGGKCPGGKCPGGKCLGGICPWGKCPGGTCPGGLSPRTARIVDVSMVTAIQYNYQAGSYEEYFIKIPYVCVIFSLIQDFNKQFATTHCELYGRPQRFW